MIPSRDDKGDNSGSKDSTGFTFFFPPFFGSRKVDIFLSSGIPILLSLKSGVSPPRKHKEEEINSSSNSVLHSLISEWRPFELVWAQIPEYNRAIGLFLLPVVLCLKGTSSRLTVACNVHSKNRTATNSWRGHSLPLFMFSFPKSAPVGNIIFCFGTEAPQR